VTTFVPGDGQRWREGDHQAVYDPNQAADSTSRYFRWRQQDFLDVVAGSFCESRLNAANECRLNMAPWRAARRCRRDCSPERNASSNNFPPGTTILSGLATTPGAYSFAD
jgi:hypothetical protein